jgi:hypothetical protein
MRLQHLDLKTVIEILEKTLQEKNPDKVSASWIYRNNPSVYRYLWKYVRLENGGIDWDKVTSHLDKSFQRKWIRYRYKKNKPYQKQEEVDIVLLRYKDRLYTFICSHTKEDRELQNRMIIRLVRIGQRGNVLAQEEIIKWVSYIVDEWIDKYPQICKWKGYRDEVEDKIRSCIRCYRYTGSFLGYLFRTLEYSARGKPPVCSLDDKFCDGEKTRIDFIASDSL